MQEEVKEVPREKMIVHDHVLEINKGANLETSFFSVKKGDKVVFKLGNSFYGEKVVVFTELPSEGCDLERGIYRKVGTEVLACVSGSFHYYFTSSHDLSRREGSGYIHVEPTICFGQIVLPIECVQSLTVLSKCLGNYSTWLDRLGLAIESGYNTIHFTPVQELGDSGSAYCLRDQLKLNPSFYHQNGPMTWDQLHAITNTLRTKWKMLTICDIVLNHSANDSPWLKAHPECTYNLENSPHLRPAYLLDIALNQLSQRIAKGELLSNGVPSVIENEDHLGALRHYLLSVVTPSLNLHEMFSVDTQKHLNTFQDLVSQLEPFKRLEKGISLTVQQDPLYHRLTSTIDMQSALALFNVYRCDCYDEDTRRRRCAEAFKTCLDEINSNTKKEIDSHLSAAVEACIATVRYFRVDTNGPRKKGITIKEPLFPRYFYDDGEGSEVKAYSDLSCYVWAHNGWVMNYDPLIDFAQPGSNVYIRRELIPWSDSVKLRYGEKEEDCPFLWKHMRNYVEQTAKVFDGVRLDNCHSTPICVAQYLLDAARKIKADLYIVAELFTNSDTTDNLFINKLGITSLIRENMSGWDSHEVGRLVYRYGGGVLGSLIGSEERPRRLAPALFLDLSHDNPHPIEKRTLYDLIPSSALVAMATCATGSTLGYDQLVPHHIHVVDEKRLYMTKADMKGKKGIMNAKLVLNKLHLSLCKEGFFQVFVDQIDSDIVAVTRFNPKTMESVIMISYTVFKWPSGASSGIGKGLTIPGMAHSVLLQARLVHKSGKEYLHPTEYTKDGSVINGLSEFEAEVEEKISLERCSMIQAVPTGNSVRLNLTQEFKPGCILAIRVVNRKSVQAAADHLRSRLIELETAAFRLDLDDLNFALYRCSGEGGPTYNVPNYGDLVYQGFQGIMSIMEEIALKDDLGHPLCENLRSGPWLGDFMVARLKSRPSTNYLADLMKKELKLVEELPVGFRPWGFYRIFSQAHRALIQRAISLMSVFVQEGGDMVRNLSLCSVQMMARISTLPPLSDNLGPPLPIKVITPFGQQVQVFNTLAAGLPHFSSGLMRCWGRDTFISLRGLLLLTWRFQEARYHILGFGGCLRHGLIPNLLDGEGLNPRFNCRDAVFWWLFSIKEYCELTPGGNEIFQDKVKRIFPTDDSSPTYVDQTLHDVIQEALTVHFKGLTFRERNAGKQIDEHMDSQGFNMEIGVCPDTGFVYGGNEWNCGTWMDKMGSSIEAGTKGKPATPRDGTAVELVGLQYAVISWLAKLSALGEYPHTGVTRLSKEGESISWSWKHWADKIKDNFEKEFWVGVDSTNSYINRRKMYKDSVGATQEWADYRLRPNFTVAMVVAEELFDREHAVAALETARVLEGPLGMKTLDPTDLIYCGVYDNSNNSSDYRVAHGYNYHQGPEWLWLTGYYLRAKMKFCLSDSVLVDVKAWLGRAADHITSSHWRGLPELTNENGQHCHDSCPTQAWSAATFFEVLHDLKNIEGSC